MDQQQGASYNPEQVIGDLERELGAAMGQVARLRSALATLLQQQADRESAAAQPPA